MNDPRYRVLVAVAEPELRELLQVRLESHGYLPTVVAASSEALALLGRERFGAAVVDLKAGDAGGLGALDEMHKRAPELPVLVLAAPGSASAAAEAVRRGAYEFILRPFHDQEFLQKLAHAVESGSLRRENAGLRRLQTALEAALMLTRDGQISADDLQAALNPSMLPAPLAAPPSTLPPPANEAARPGLDGLESLLGLLRDGTSRLPQLREARDLFERTYLAEVLRRAGGNVTLAARMAGRNRTDFYELLRRHRLSASSFKP